MRNVEIKAKVDNFEDLLKKAEDISQSKATLILQDDTFFKSERGRLKLRVFEVTFIVYIVKTLKLFNVLCSFFRMETQN